MQSLPVLKALFGYQAWANGLMLDNLATLTSEELAAPCSGTGSILVTAIHTITGLEALLGVGIEAAQTGVLDFVKAAQSRDEGPKEMTIAQLQARWAEADAKARAFFASATDDQLEAKAEFKMPNVPPGLQIPVWQMALQACEHTTHTRAQVISAVRLLGKQPARVDFLVYALKGMPNGY